MKRLSILILSIALLGCAPVTGAETAPLQNDPNIQLAIAGAQLTGTAQAFEMQVVGWTVTAQSWTSTPSPVPTATMTPSITPTPTIDVTQTLVVQKMNAEIKEIELQTKRKEITNTFWAVFLPFMSLVGLVLLAYALITLSRERRKKVIKKDENGEAPLVADAVTGQVVDMNHAANHAHGSDAKDILWNMFQAYMQQKHGIAPLTPAITAERQDEANRLAIRSRLPKRLPEPEPTPEAPKQLTAAHDAGGLFPLPDWSLVNGWQGDKSLLP
ncbi:MAG: hypothetical protein E6R03_15870, partial [Hyphomicrobiaceae bacterium]